MAWFKKISQYISLCALWAYFLVPYFPANTPQLFGKSIAVPQIILLLAFICSGFSFLYSLIHREEHIPRHIIELGASFALLLLVLASSTVLAHGFSKETGLLISSLVALCTTFFISSRLNRASIDIFFKSYAWVTIAACTLGFLQFYFLGDSASPAAYLGQAGHVFNATGFANYSALFAISLALSMPLFLLLGHIRYLGTRMLWTIAFLMSISALLLTFSRSALFAGAVACTGALIWCFYKKYDKKFSIFIVLASLCIGYATLSYVPPKNYASEIFSYHASAGELLSERLEPVFTTSPQQLDWSAKSRFTFYRVAERMFFATPQSFLIGYGIFGFNQNWDLFRGDFGTPTGLDPHSTYIEVAVGGGLAGLTAFVLFLFLLYRFGWSIRDKEPVVIGLLFGLGAMLIDGVLHTHFYTKYFWIFGGVTAALIWLKNKEESKKDLIEQESV